jgi:hypothetical protein
VRFVGIGRYVAGLLALFALEVLKKRFWPEFAPHNPTPKRAFHITSPEEFCVFLERRASFWKGASF